MDQEETSPGRAAPNMTVRRLRLARNLSQQELADRAGISRYIVSTTETGTHRPLLSTLQKLAKALGVSVEELTTPPAELPQDVSDWALSPSTATFRRNVRDATTETIRGSLLPFLSGAQGAARATGDREAYKRALARWRIARDEWLTRVGPLEERKDLRGKRVRRTRAKPSATGDGEAASGEAHEETA